MDTAVVESLADALSPATIEAAVEQAMADEREAMAGSGARRAAIARELDQIQRRIARLTEAVAAGSAATAPLLGKLGEEEARRVELARERDALLASAGAVDFATAKVRQALVRQAARVRAALLTHREEAREVLQAFVERIDVAPFGAGHARGYSFKGTGDYGVLLGQTPRLSGVPDGPHPRRTPRSRVSPAERLRGTEVPGTRRMACHVQHLLVSP
jgi:hypothetical protein